MVNKNGISKLCLYGATTMEYPSLAHMRFVSLLTVKGFYHLAIKIVTGIQIYLMINAVISVHHDIVQNVCVVILKNTSFLLIIIEKCTNVNSIICVGTNSRRW